MSEAYETQVPWNRTLGHHGGRGEAVCVDVRSSMPLPDALTRLSSGSDFARAVRELLLQDLRLLPVADPNTQFVERGNVSVYTEQQLGGGEVLVVYAPSSLVMPQPEDYCAARLGARRLEFISLACPRRHPS